MCVYTVRVRELRALFMHSNGSKIEREPTTKLPLETNAILLRSGRVIARRLTLANISIRSS